MPAKPAIRVDGARELRRAIRKAQDDLSKQALKDTHLEGAELVAREGERQAPKDEGTLAGDIRAAGLATKAVVRVGRKSVPYAGPIHFGWPGHNIAPNPFLYDALDDRQEEVVAVYEDRVRDIINALQRGTP